MVEAGLQQFWKVVVLGCANQAWDVAAGKWTRAGVQIVQQDSEGFRIKFDYVELERENLFFRIK